MRSSRSTPNELILAVQKNGEFNITPQSGMKLWLAEQAM
jgi:hypothetical protein